MANELTPPEGFVEVGSRHEIFDFYANTSIDGRFMGIDEGGKYACPVIRTAEKIYRLPSHRVLLERFGSVPIGARVWVICLGETTGTAGRKYVDYRVFQKPAEKTAEDTAAVDAGKAPDNVPDTSVDASDNVPF